METRLLGEQLKMCDVDVTKLFKQGFCVSYSAIGVIILESVACVFTLEMLIKILFINVNQNQ